MRFIFASFVPDLAVNLWFHHLLPWRFIALNHSVFYSRFTGCVLFVFADNLTKLAEKWRLTVVKSENIEEFFAINPIRFSYNNHWHSIIKIRKIFFKKLAVTSCRKRKTLYFCTRFPRGSGFLQTGDDERNDREGERNRTIPVWKNNEKSPWRERKRHYICNPFPEGNPIGRLGLKFYDIMSTKER